MTNRISALRRLFDLTYSARTPLICTFELNRDCNLRCKHCYLSASRAKPLSTSEIKQTLSQLSRAGVLSLVFTGGEIFLRKDIFELCAFARRLHFDLRLFTNGTLIDETAAEKISRLDISAVEISLYGKKKTHDGITGRPGSFEKSVNALKLLSGLGVKTAIKTPLSTMNFKDFGWITLLAKKLKVKLQVDPVITGKDDGTASALKYRINDSNLKKVLLLDAAPRAEFTGKSDPKDLLCSAGRNLVAVRADGNVYPCLQLPVKLGNIKSERINSIWNIKNKKMRRFLDVTPEKLTVCGACELAKICQRCPGLALSEDKDLLGPSKTACKIAKIKKNLIFSSKII